MIYYEAEFHGRHFLEVVRCLLREKLDLLWRFMCDVEQTNIAVIKVGMTVTCPLYQGGISRRRYIMFYPHPDIFHLIVLLLYICSYENRPTDNPLYKSLH